MMSNEVKTIAPSSARVCYGSKGLHREARGLFSKIENDLCAIFGRFGWSFGVCLAGMGYFDSNMVRMMLAGFLAPTVIRTADAHFSKISALVPGFGSREAAFLAVG